MAINRAVYDGDGIDVTYTIFTPGIGDEVTLDRIHTTPNSNWTNLNFGPDSQTWYVDFLNSMVVKDLSVYRKMAKLMVETYEGSYSELMHTITILDPTFTPPIINERAWWQRDLVKDIAMNTSQCVIATCMNERRLDRYIRTLTIM
jgi:hypothetical protein